MLEASTYTWRAGVVTVRQDGRWLTPRPAVFFFDTPAGWCWVEPSYAAPQGSGFALHEREGKPVQLSPSYFRWEGGTERIEITEFDQDSDGEALAAPIVWFEGHLREIGRSMQEERQRLRDELAEQGVL